MAYKNITEAKNISKTTVFTNLFDALKGLGYEAIQIEDFEIAIPQNCGEFDTQYVRIALTSADTKGTKVRAGFTVDGAIAKWQARLAEAEASRLIRKTEAEARKSIKEANKKGNKGE